MVHGIIYGLLVMVLLVTNLLHIQEKNRLKDNRDFWREKAVKNEKRTERAERETNKT